MGEDFPPKAENLKSVHKIQSKNKPVQLQFSSPFERSTGLAMLPLQPANNNAIPVSLSADGLSIREGLSHSDLAFDGPIRSKPRYPVACCQGIPA